MATAGEPKTKTPRCSSSSKSGRLLSMPSSWTDARLTCRVDIHACRHGCRPAWRCAQTRALTCDKACASVMAAAVAVVSSELFYTQAYMHVCTQVCTACLYTGSIKYVLHTPSSTIFLTRIMDHSVSRGFGSHKHSCPTGSGDMLFF